MKKKMIIFGALFALVLGTSVASFGHNNPTVAGTSSAPADTIKSQPAKRSQAGTATSDTTKGTKSSVKSKSGVSADTTSKK
jgi:hypothetical protein